MKSPAMTFPHSMRSPLVLWAIVLVALILIIVVRSESRRDAQESRPQGTFAAATAEPNG